MGFFMRPVFPFALELLIVAPLILGIELPEMEPLYLFLAPWLLLLLAALNLPLLVSLFRQFQMDRATRRNHALEHATIQLLWAAGFTQVAGKASPQGFRVSGAPSPVDIRRAFERVTQLLEAGEPLPHVSRHCGSNRVTALALAMLMLLLLAAASVAFRPPLWLRASLLVCVVIFFSAMRHAVGNAVQRRFFMATDFARAAIEDVRKLKATPLERAPVYFIQTRVS